MKKLFAVILACSSIGFGSERVSFDSTQSAVVRAVKDGEDIKLTVSPLALEKNAKGKPTDVLKYLDAELGKALESQGGMIPGKLYVEKQPDGDYMVRAVYVADLESFLVEKKSRFVDSTDTAGRAYAKVFVKVTNAIKKPKLECLSVIDHKSALSEKDVRIELSEAGIKRYIENYLNLLSSNNRKNATEQTVNGFNWRQLAEEFSKQHTLLHEYTHAKDYLRYPLCIVALKVRTNSKELRSIMANKASKGSGKFEVVDNNKIIKDLANDILYHMEGRAVMTQVLYNISYLRSISLYLKGGRFEKLSTIQNTAKNIPMSQYTYNEVVSVTDDKLIAMGELDEMKSQVGLIKGTATSYQGAYSKLLKYTTPRDQWQGTELKKFIVNINKLPQVFYVSKNGSFVSGELPFVNNVYGIINQVSDSDFKKKVESFEAEFIKCVQEKCKQEGLENIAGGISDEEKSYDYRLINIKLAERKSYIGDNLDDLYKEMSCEDNKSLSEILEYIVKDFNTDAEGKKVLTDRDKDSARKAAEEVCKTPDGLMYRWILMAKAKRAAWVAREEEVRKWGEEGLKRGMQAARNNSSAADDVEKFIKETEEVRKKVVGLIEQIEDNDYYDSEILKKAIKKDGEQVVPWGSNGLRFF